MATTTPGDARVPRTPAGVVRHLIVGAIRNIAAAVLPRVFAGCATGSRVDATCWTRADLRALFGDYEIVDAVRYRGGLTPDAVMRASIGERMALKRRRFERAGRPLSSPAYAATCEVPLAEGDVPDAAHRRSDFYGLRDGGQTTRLLEVRDAAHPDAPPRTFEVVGDELWELRDGWLLKLRKRESRPVRNAIDTVFPSRSQDAA